MSDLISRQAAIDALRLIPCDLGKRELEDAIKAVEQLPSARTEPLMIRVNNELTKEEYEKLMHDIKDAPIVLLPSAQPEQRWIPCGERLPEDNSDILVTYVEKDEKRIAPVNYGCGTWFDCFFNKVLDQVGVLAWMPLPEPYEAESEDKE